MESQKPLKWARNKDWKKSKVKIFVTDQQTGFKVALRKRKSIPKMTSRPRQICIVCKIISIPKRSVLYEKKVCAGCQ